MRLLLRPVAEPRLFGIIERAGEPPTCDEACVRRGAHIGHSGNERLRTAVSLATLSAARFNPMIRAFSQRLRAAGKPVKVACCAAARKLLHLAWALVTKRQCFDPHRHPSLAPITA